VTAARAQRPLRFATVAAAALGLLVAGCGESRKQASATTTTPAPPPATAQTAPPATTETKTAPAVKADFTVTEHEYAIDPRDLKVAKTGTFTLSVSNAGTIPHALVVEGPRGKAKTGAIAPGQSAQLKIRLTKPGRYAWYCPIDGHRDRGMIGSVIVAGGGKNPEGGGASEIPPPSSGGSGGNYQNYP
jgi:uncharacterized cupredoxin-like copper-binding protein